MNKSTRNGRMQQAGNSAPVLKLTVISFLLRSSMAFLVVGICCLINSAKLNLQDTDNTIV